MIEIKKLKFSYSKRRELFSDLNLELLPGHIYGLLGKNGAGKTTLLKIITGLCFSSGGKITVLNENPAERKAKMLERIFFLPEEINSPMLKLKDFLKANSVFYPKFDEKQFYELLEEMEFDQFDNLISKLSLGQKKKIALAFAVATNTEILIMDEPTNALDIPSKSIFRRIIARVASEDKIILISTHQVRDLHSLLDSVIILDKGKILLNKSSEDITAKLKFSLLKEEDCLQEKILYSEDSVNGILAVCENKNNEETNLDLELLFNATMSNEELIYNLFNSINE